MLISALLDTGDWAAAEHRADTADLLDLPLVKANVEALRA